LSYRHDPGAIAVTDGIEIKFTPGRGLLELSCSDDSFARISNLVVSESGSTTPADEIHLILISRTSSETEIREKHWGRDRIALIGCAMIAFIFLFVLTTGIWTIVGWAR
jgi:hypothetical protein